MNHETDVSFPLGHELNNSTSHIPHIPIFKKVHIFNSLLKTYYILLAPAVHNKCTHSKTLTKVEK